MLKRAGGSSKWQLLDVIAIDDYRRGRQPKAGGFELRFASASYMLVPELLKESSLLERAKARGTGIWTPRRHPFQTQERAAPASLVHILAV
jgi:hypothetical protein